MAKTITTSFKDAYKGAVERFRTEELFFGLSAIGTILIDYGSIVPSLIVYGLMAFYYFFFGWYMLATKGEKYTLFSIAAGIVYSVCLIGMMVILLDKQYIVSSTIFQLALLCTMVIILWQRNWGVYKGNHYIRIGVFVFLNFYICLFK